MLLAYIKQPLEKQTYKTYSCVMWKEVIEDIVQKYYKVSFLA